MREPHTFRVDVKTRTHTLPCGRGLPPNAIAATGPHSRGTTVVVLSGSRRPTRLGGPRRTPVSESRRQAC